MGLLLSLLGLWGVSWVLSELGVFGQDDGLDDIQSRDDGQIEGTDGRDKIEGTDGNDFLRAGAGRDTISAEDGNDTVFGETGNDKIYGGAGSDLLDGGIGNDTITGMFGDDTVLGGDGHDLLSGGMGNDVLSGGNGNDHLSGPYGEDTFFGGAGNDILVAGTVDTFDPNVLSGETGDDFLKGGRGDDILDGGFGYDTILANDGDDELIAGYGGAEMTGGEGSDIFWVDAESTHFSSIEDFSLEEDALGFIAPMGYSGPLLGADGYFTSNPITFQLWDSTPSTSVYVGGTLAVVIKGVEPAIIAEADIFVSYKPN